jgi:hypothetical protein
MRLEELADLVLDLFDPLRLLKIGQEARLDDGILKCASIVPSTLFLVPATAPIRS